MSISSLVVAFFLRVEPGSSGMRLIGPLHDAFVTLGVLTALSAWYFAALRPDDGANVSHHRSSAEPDALTT